jgi:hypothetical protein
MLKIVFDHSELEVLSRTYPREMKNNIVIQVPGYAKMVLGVQRYVASREMGNPLAENEVQALYANGTLLVDSGLPADSIRDAVQKCIASLASCGDVPKDLFD